MSDAFLEVRGLTVRAGDRVIVDAVDVAAGRGRTLGVVGESGPQGLCRFDEGVDELVVDRLVHDDARGGGGLRDELDPAVGQ